MKNKKDTLTEEIQFLEELIRRAYSLISPLDYKYDLEWLLKQNERNALFEKNPKCFLKLKYMGREVVFFPICNRSGIINKDMISLSLKMIDRLSGNDHIDQDALVITATKLRAIQSKYSKDIPKPTDMASKKSIVTKFINNVAKKYRFKK